jgi:hypothetical protein
MAKKTATRRRAPDMSNYVSPRMQKGARYLVGKQKTTFIARVRKAFGKTKVRQLEAK